MDKDFRITLPIKEIRKINVKPEDYVKIILRKEEKLDYFYIRIPFRQPSRSEIQVRRKIPKGVRNNLNLEENDLIEIESMMSVKIKRSRRTIVNEKIDILSLSLDGFMVDSFTKNEDEWLRIWYSNKYGYQPKEVEIKRFLPINKNTGEFFGLIQAESRKSGEKFDFTNRILSEHIKFVKVAESFGLSRNMWSYQIFHNPNLTEDEIERYKTEFCRALSISIAKGGCTKSNTVKTVAFNICINSKILNFLFMSILKNLKDSILSENIREDDFLKEFSEGFIIKSLLGDGTVTIHKDKEMQICISEQDRTSQRDIVSFFEQLGFRTNTFENKIYLCKDLALYLWMIRNEVFKEHAQNRGKFLASVFSNFYIKKLNSRLNALLDKPLTYSEFAKKNNIHKKTALKWLNDNVKRGFIEKEVIIENRNKAIKYKLTSRGLRTLKTLQKGIGELTKMLNTFNCKNIDELLKRLINKRS